MDKGRQTLRFPLGGDAYYELVVNVLKPLPNAVFEVVDVNVVTKPPKENAR